MTASETPRGNGANPAVEAGHQSTENQPPAGVFFRNCYAVLVRGKAVRRHLFFNLPAATRAVNRAKARGDRAEMILVRLVPVDARHLDQEVDE